MKAAWCVAALMTAIVTLPMPARAAGLPLEDESYDRPRFYLGFGPLIGIENFHLGNQNASFDGPDINADVVDQTWGAEMRAGYRFHPHLAAELQGQYNGQFEVKGNTIGRPLLGEVTAVTGTANLKVYALRGPVQPYALGGLGILWADTEDKADGADLPTGDIEFAGRGGIGVDAYISPMLAFTVEGTYIAPTGSLAGYGHAAITAGMQWHF